MKNLILEILNKMCKYENLDICLKIVSYQWYETQISLGMNNICRG